MSNKFILSVFLLIVKISAVEAQHLREYLLPIPQKLEIKEGLFKRKEGRILFKNNNLRVLEISKKIQETLSSTSIKSELTNQLSKNEEHMLSIEIDTLLPKQGYSLNITKNSIDIIGGDMAGLFYAYSTLRQISHFAIKNNGWPCVEIGDSPDFSKRGVMIDISRNKVPTMETLYVLIDQLAAWKINEIQLYTEHTFAYQNHKVVWEDASPITAEEILLLDAYCKERYIDLVPNQNSFGHMEKWLEHDEYLHLAELPGPTQTAHSVSSRTSISPVVPQSLQLMDELYGELLPNFSSQYVNIGCDETIELGYGLSSELCKEKGTGQVYLDFLVQLNDAANNYGKKVQFWGDIILHYPELIPNIPKDMVALVWGYEADHPFEEQSKKFKESGLSFYVCPGTSTWGTILGRTKNSFENLYNAAINGKKNGAVGYLNTAWGDLGHWQPLSISYPPFAYGAALSWQVENNKDINVNTVISHGIFKDESSTIGDILMNLGNAYLETGILVDNNNIFHWILRKYDADRTKEHYLKKISVEKLNKALVFLEVQLERLYSTQILCDEKEVVYEELIHAIELTKFACNYGKAKLKTPKGDLKNLARDERQQLIADLNSIIYNHKELWIKRNRIGGLDDSVGYMTNILSYLNE